jgi:hypothetical protein
MVKDCVTLATKADSVLLSLTLSPSPGGRGKLKPFSPREKGGDEGNNATKIGNA